MVRILVVWKMLIGLDIVVSARTDADEGGCWGSGGSRASVAGGTSVSGFTNEMPAIIFMKLVA